MIPIKIKIKKRFQAAGNSYENVAHVQKNSAKLLVEKLQGFDFNFYPKTVLDLGTGTGYVPESLLSYYPNSTYTLNDIAEGMIEKVQYKFKNYDNFKFYIGDMEKSFFQNHELIISNFALQWTYNLQAILQKFFLQSNIIAFTCLLDGTFIEWDNIIKSYGLPSVLKQYPTKNSLSSYLEEFKALGYHFDTRNFQLTFPNAHSFMIHLKSLGASTSHIHIPLSTIKNIITNQKSEFTVTYKVFFGIIKRL